MPKNSILPPDVHFTLVYWNGTVIRTSQKLEAWVAAAQGAKK